MSTIIIGSNPAQLPMDEPLRDCHLSNIIRQLRDHASQWKKIGRRLGFREGELNNIGAGPDETPEDLLCTMLSVWLQWAPGDGRGSTEHATLSALKSALNNAGFGRTAEQLHISVAEARDESAEPIPKRPQLNE